MNQRTSSVLAAACATAIFGALGCDEPTVELPASLDGPVAMALPQGQVCLDLVEITDDGLLEPQIRECARADDGSAVERSGFAVIANTQSNRLGVMALDYRTIQLVDLDQASPGVTNVLVGRHPVSVATSPTGEVAYTANQLDATLSVVDLWSMSALEDTIELPSAPIKVAVRPDNAQVVAGVVSPSQLVIHPGVTCEKPAGLPAPPRELEPGACAGVDSELAAVELDGVLKDFVVDPTRGLVYAIYNDRAYVSVVALDDEARAGEACLAGDSTPCEIERISLAYGCSDGIDNDGDGLVDAADKQCYGPFGAESADGIGRRVIGACADGLDNDGDGLVDRDDESCRDSGQVSEDAADVPAFDEDVSACADGADNDGDGLADDADPDCYGPFGRTERAQSLRGYGAIATDELGVMLYVTQTSGRQVLIIDLASRTLIDAPRSASSPEPFTDTLGVALGSTPVPTAISGRIERSVQRDPRPGYALKHGLMTYQLGAYVTADNGLVYFVDAGNIYCDLWSTTDLNSKETFYLEPGVVMASSEASCFSTISAPVNVEAAAGVFNCGEIDRCSRCVTSSEKSQEEALEDCTACNNITAEEYGASATACQLDERRASLGLSSSVFNPIFAVRDNNASQSGIRSSCDQPEEMIARMQEYIAENSSAPKSIGCGSPLQPQPVSSYVTSSTDDYSDAVRADLSERRELFLFMEGDGSVGSEVDLAPDDYRAVSQDWSVVYEGVLPGTRRSDGFVDAEREGVFDIGTLDPCVSDVRVGDLLIIRSEPGTESGGVSSECEGFADATGENVALRTFRITSVAGSELGIELMSADGEEFVTELPTRACFPRGLDYEIRAAESWIVYGSESGLASGKRLVDGACVPGNGANFMNANSRVATGEDFVGPGISFSMYPGLVEPVRGLEYTIAVSREFAIASNTLGSPFSTSNVNTSQVLHADLFLYSVAGIESYNENLSTNEENNPVPGAAVLDLLLATDPSDNTIFVQSISKDSRASFVR